MKKPPLLDSEEIIKVKTQMVDNLLEIEVAYSLLKQEKGGEGAKDPLDVHYEQLKTDMEVCVQGCVCMCVCVCVCDIITCQNGIMVRYFSSGR